MNFLFFSVFLSLFGKHLLLLFFSFFEGWMGGRWCAMAVDANAAVKPGGTRGTGHARYGWTVHLPSPDGEGTFFFKFLTSQCLRLAMPGTLVPSLGRMHRRFVKVIRDPPGDGFLRGLENRMLGDNQLTPSLGDWSENCTP